MKKFLIAATLITAFSASSFASVCERQTSRHEQALGIPAHLLTAIARTESGQWSQHTQRSEAWPWTVTSRKGDVKYATKGEAIKAVKRLQKSGVRNIDVGCMQINLRHHPDAFKNLRTAFDPAANVAYAANFLSRLYTETGDWRMAAAYYHSRKPQHYGSYQTKVENFWQQARVDAGLPWYTGPASTYAERSARSWRRAQRFVDAQTRTPRWAQPRYRYAPSRMSRTYAYNIGRPWTPDRANDAVPYRNRTSRFY